VCRLKKKEEKEKKREEKKGKKKKRKREQRYETAVVTLTRGNLRVKWNGTRFAEVIFLSQIR